MRQAQRSTLTGVIESRNDRGVKLNGQWFNYSRWADSLDEVNAGDRVELTIDSQGFIRKLRKLAQTTSGTEESRTSRVSNEWLRTQALELAIKVAELQRWEREECRLSSLYELADEILGALMHGFPVIATDE